VKTVKAAYRGSVALWRASERLLLVGLRPRRRLIAKLRHRGQVEQKLLTLKV
jgi:hypothetical protein